MPRLARTAVVAVAFASLGALSVGTLAQQPDPVPESPTAGLVRKHKVPVSTEVLKAKLPRPAEADLANGLHLIVLEDHRVPLVSFQLFVPGAGGYYDPADRPGLASFTAAMLREGTATRTSEQISEQLEVMAASLTFGAGASSPEATMTGSCLSDHVSRLLDLAADALLHPAFADQELARYKQRTRALLLQQRSSPGFLAAEMFSRAIYGSHPAARLSPTAAALDRTTRDDLAEFHRLHYAPNRAVIAVAGDLSMAEASKLLETRFGAWATAASAPPSVTNPAPLAVPNIYFIARPSSVQTNLIVGTQAIERTSPDYDVLSVMNKVIGGGPTGRLFIHLREEKGYTYGASSALNAPRYRGEWQAATNVRTEVTEPALNDLLAEIRRLRDEPVPADELGDAKRSMVASFALSLESPARLVDLAITRWRYRLPADYWDRYAERVMAVTSDAIRAAARKYLAADRLQIVAVGDPARVADPLRKLGSVTVCDADGQCGGTPH